MLTHQKISANDAGRRLVINFNLILHWIQDLEPERSNVFLGNGNGSVTEKELHQLHAENRRFLKIPIDHLREFIKTSRKLISFALLTITLFADKSARTVFAQQQWLEDKHDPCVIKQGDRFYMFTSGIGCPVASSKDLINWRDHGVALKSFPTWAIGVTQNKDHRIWAPDISYFGGRYRLYYSVSEVGKNRSAISFASNETLDPTSPKYQWIDHGKPIIESFPNKDDFNAIDPNIVFDDHKNPYISFGSYWGGIMMCRIDIRTGIPAEARLTKIASRSRPDDPIEAPFIIRRNGFYYLFVSLGHCHLGSQSNYHIVCGRSIKIDGPYLDRKGNSMIGSGGTIVLKGYDRFRGPGHNAVLIDREMSFLIHSYFDSVKRSPAELQIRSLLWSQDGWPLPGKPIEKTAANEGAITAGVVSSWKHSVDFGKPQMVNLLPNGIAEKPTGRWSLVGRKLTLRWPNNNGGEWVDDCILDPSGRWYSGRNQEDLIIIGERRTSGSQ